MLTATRPLLRWLMVAICLASTEGVHGPGQHRGDHLQRLGRVQQRMLNETDSCWFSAP